jgi:hypothetical protein
MTLRRRILLGPVGAVLVAIGHLFEKLFVIH